jgi:hypothetical protein
MQTKALRLFGGFEFVVRGCGYIRLVPLPYVMSKLHTVHLVSLAMVGGNVVSEMEQ